MENHPHKQIVDIVERYRLKRAAQRATANDAIDLAKAAELILAEIAETNGAESADFLRSSTLVASEMLNILIDNINRHALDPAKGLSGATRVLEYIDKLPVDVHFRDNRYLPQREIILQLAEKHHVRGSAYGINFFPTVGDDAYFASCRSYDDYSRYTHRHPSGRHYGEARSQMLNIKGQHAKRIKRRRLLWRLFLACLGAALTAAVCLIAGMLWTSIFGVFMVEAGIICAFYVSKATSDAIPRPKLRKLWLAAVAAVLVLGGGALILTESVRAQRAQLDGIIANRDEDAMMEYLTDANNTYYAEEALAAYLSMMDSIFFNPEQMEKPSRIPPLARMQNFSKNELLLPETQVLIAQRAQARTDSLYRLTVNDGTLRAWQRYQSLAPSEFFYDSSEKIDSIEEVLWSQEATAWLQASSDNTKDSYTRYVETYPLGSHVAAANSRLIDFEVKDYRNQGQPLVDNIDRVADYDGGGSKVCIYNNSDFVVTFMFSGPKSVKFSIMPHDYKDAAVADGSYQVLVKVDNGDQFSFVQAFDHGIYSSSIELSKHDESHQ